MTDEEFARLQAELASFVGAQAAGVLSVTIGRALQLWLDEYRETIVVTHGAVPAAQRAIAGCLLLAAESFELGAAELEAEA